MAVALTITAQIPMPRGILATFTLAFSGSYALGGDSASWQSAGIRTTRAPKYVFAKGKAGYDYEYDRANNKWIVRDFPKVVVTGGQAAGAAVQILPDSDAGVFGKTAATTRNIPGRTFGFVMDELAAAAYPAGVTGDTIEGFAIFDKLI